jgi:hypothetical protein
LLVAVRRYVGENIKKRMSFILEAWEFGNYICFFVFQDYKSQKIPSGDLENDEGVYKDVVHYIYFKGFRHE